MHLDDGVRVVEYGLCLPSVDPLLVVSAVVAPLEWNVRSQPHCVQQLPRPHAVTTAPPVRGVVRDVGTRCTGWRLREAAGRQLIVHGPSLDVGLSAGPALQLWCVVLEEGKVDVCVELGFGEAGRARVPLVRGVAGGEVADDGGDDLGGAAEVDSRPVLVVE